MFWSQEHGLCALLLYRHVCETVSIHVTTDNPPTESLQKVDLSNQIITTYLLHAETAKEDSVAQGAAALLRAQSLFRAVSRQPSALAGLVAALMAGSQYNIPKAQQSILDCYLMFALRFIRPPQLALAQVSSAYACLLACLIACLPDRLFGGLVD